MTLTASAAHSHSLYFSRAATSTSPHTVPVASFAASPSRRRLHTPPPCRQAPPTPPHRTATSASNSSATAIAEHCPSNVLHCRRHC
ncbi:hypothetical protein DAI22_02g086850 [Oryza sativa Japonica Group]|nr:hypothetical protein DAI22_02g086850 [Oryza sativa Japonica Group]